MQHATNESHKPRNWRKVGHLFWNGIMVKLNFCSNFSETSECPGPNWGPWAPNLGAASRIQGLAPTNLEATPVFLEPLQEFLNSF